MKKVLCGLLAAAMCAAAVPGFAITPTAERTTVNTLTNGTTYVNKSLGVTTTQDDSDAEVFTIAAENPAAYLFTATAPDGSVYSYSLLDSETGADGKKKYFIYAADRFQRVRLNEDPANNIFDPDSETPNIATWLNTDLLNGTETQGTITPSAGGYWISTLDPGIKDYLVEHDWRVLGTGVYTVTANGHDPSYAYPAGDAVVNDFYVRCKLALLSITEYIKYADKIGYKSVQKVAKNEGGTYATLFRDGRSGDALDGASSTTRYIDQMRYFGDGSGNTNFRTVTSKYVNNTYKNYEGTVIRICFYLDEDYFKNVKLTSAGSEVAKILKTDFSYSDLSEKFGGLYTDAELGALGVMSQTNCAQLVNGVTPVYKEAGRVVAAADGTDENDGRTPFTISGEAPETARYTFSYTAENDRTYHYSLLDSATASDGTKRYLLFANNRYGKFELNDKAEPANNLFDPDSETPNIATWLNTDFYNGTSLQGGFTTDNPLPIDPAVKTHAVEHLYLTEGANVVASGGYDFYALCKVALLSAGEYIKYSDKIQTHSVEYTAEAGTGIEQTWLRSPSRWEAGARQMWWFNAGKNTSGVTGNTSTAPIIEPDPTKPTLEGYGASWIRPCFWVSENYFKETHIPVSAMGDAVKATLSSDFTYDDLKATYSSAEMKELGIKGLYISEGSWSALDNTASFTLENTTGTEITPTVVMAAYADDGKRLVEVAVVTAEAGVYSYTFRAEDLMAADIKAFVFSDFSGIEPYFPPVTFR